MDRTATIIGIAYLVVIVVGAVLALVLGNSTFLRKPIDREQVERREQKWLIVVVAMLVALLFATIFFAPYGRSAPKDAQNVAVTAQQFGWIITPSRLKANVPVVFTLRSKDVNHGFGLYDAGDTLLAQVQVIPEQTAQLVFTFRKPGTYRVLCLEFCGAGHHQMVSTLEVTQ